MGSAHRAAARTGAQRPGRHRRRRPPRTRRLAPAAHRRLRPDPARHPQLAAGPGRRHQLGQDPAVPVRRGGRHVAPRGPPRRRGAPLAHGTHRRPRPALHRPPHRQGPADPRGRLGRLRARGGRGLLPRRPQTPQVRVLRARCAATGPAPRPSSPSSAPTRPPSLPRTEATHEHQRTPPRHQRPRPAARRRVARGPSRREPRADLALRPRPRHQRHPTAPAAGRRGPRPHLTADLRRRLDQHRRGPAARPRPLRVQPAPARGARGGPHPRHGWRGRAGLGADRAVPRRDLVATDRPARQGRWPGHRRGPRADGPRRHRRAHQVRGRDAGLHRPSAMDDRPGEGTQVRPPRRPVRTWPPAAPRRARGRREHHRHRPRPRLLGVARADRRHPGRSRPDRRLRRRAARVPLRPRRPAEPPLHRGPPAPGPAAARAAPDSRPAPG